MKSLLPGPRRRGGDDNLIPLINIVFLLLIFFMIAGQLRHALPDLELPQGDVGSDYEQRDMRLALDRDNALSLNGEAIDHASLAERLKGRPDSVTVLAHRDLRADQLDQTLDLLRQAGITQFSLLSERPESSL